MERLDPIFAQHITHIESTPRGGQYQHVDSVLIFAENPSRVWLKHSGSYNLSENWSESFNFASPPSALAWAQEETKRLES